MGPFSLGKESLGWINHNRTNEGHHLPDIIFKSTWNNFSECVLYDTKRNKSTYEVLFLLLTFQTSCCFQPKFPCHRLYFRCIVTVSNFRYSSLKMSLIYIIVNPIINQYSLNTYEDLSSDHFFFLNRTVAKWRLTQWYVACRYNIHK